MLHKLFVDQTKILKIYYSLVFAFHQKVGTPRYTCTGIFLTPVFIVCLEKLSFQKAQFFVNFLDNRNKKKF